MNEKTKKQKDERLYLSESDKKIAGVFGGIGERYDVDATLLRIIWIVVTVFSGIVPGVLAYVFGWAVIPKRPDAK